MEGYAGGCTFVQTTPCERIYRFPEQIGSFGRVEVFRSQEQLIVIGGSGVIETHELGDRAQELLRSFFSNLPADAMLVLAPLSMKITASSKLAMRMVAPHAERCLRCIFAAQPCSHSQDELGMPVGEIIRRVLESRTPRYVTVSVGSGARYI